MHLIKTYFYKSTYITVIIVMQEMLVAVTGCPCKTESMIVFRGLNVAIFYPLLF